MFNNMVWICCLTGLILLAGKSFADGSTQELQDEVNARIYWERSIQRIDRPETIYLRVERPVAMTPWNVNVELHVPDNIQLLSTSQQTSDSWQRLRVALTTGAGGGTPQFVDSPTEFCEFSWAVQVDHPSETPFRAVYTLPDGATADILLPAHFQQPLEIVSLDYVPEPKPAVSDFHVGGIYFPGWKPGSHYGWSILDAYPERMPALGYYDESNPEVMDWQIKWSVEHGMTFFMFCWYRQYGSEGQPISQHLEHALHDGFFNARYESMMDFAIMWENGNLAGVSDMDDLMHQLFPYWMEHYFKRPNYLVIDNKPVLFIYDIQRFVKDLGSVEAVKAATDAMRAAAIDEGFDGLYLLAEHRGNSQHILGMMRDCGMDYSFAYCFHSVSPEASQEEAVAHLHDLHTARFGMRSIIPDVPTLSVGWNPEPWEAFTNYHPSPHWWLKPEAYKAQARNLRALMEQQPSDSLSSRMVMLDNLNEWGEGHYILPHREFGFGYLDAVRSVFTDSDDPHMDILPDEVGLGPYDAPHNEWVREVTARYDTTAEEPSLQHSDTRPIVGAIRWDAWHGDASEVGLIVERTLSPAHWHDRLPFYAAIPEEHAVEVRANTQEIMDQEIAYARDAGLDYWAFVIYPEDDPLSLGLKLYLSSEKKGDINFCLNLQGGWESGDGPDAWPDKVARYISYFKDPAYQTVMNGRPLVYLFSVEGLVGSGRFETWEAARAAFDLLRDTAREEGIPNPYIVAQGWSADTLKDQAEALGLDAIGAYASNAGHAAASYASLVAHTEAWWDAFRLSGLPVVPLVTAGWDMRPRVETPVPWVDGGDITLYYEQPTPEELAGHLKRGIEWCNAYPDSAEAQAILIYAWNEFDEGGWLCPTLEEGTARLDAIATVLQPVQTEQTD